MTAAIFAKALYITGGVTPREWIQYMPIKAREIACTVDGQPAKQLARGTQTGAAALQRDLEAAHAAGRKVFIDYNHEADEASGWVQEFRWHPEEGIQARIAWTAAGEAAVRGRSYDSFSPEWKIDRQTGECLGLLPGRPAGGLVNLAAFTDIASVAARLNSSAAAEPNKNTNDMKQDQIAAAALASGLITKEQAASDDAGKHTAAAIAALQASAAAGVQAKATTASDLAAVQAKATAAETELTALRTEQVDGLITAAQARLAIPPQDAAAAAEWKELCSLPGAPGKAARARLAQMPGKLPQPTGAGVTAGQVQTPEQENNAADKLAGAIRARAAEICATDKKATFSSAWARAEKELSAR